MNNANETSLQVIENKGILVKIVNFLKKILNRGKSNYIISSNQMTSNEKGEKTFFESIKIEKDPDREKLLWIQDELEKRGINQKNAYELTKYLSNVQKQKLEALYQEQIKELEISIESYKNTAINMRKKLTENN